MFHEHPGDNWRFYSDAGQALVYWSGKIINGTSHPVSLVETFHIYPIKSIWVDFVGIWKRTDVKEDSIRVSKEMKEKRGPLRKSLEDNGARTACPFGGNL